MKVYEGIKSQPSKRRHSIMVFEACQRDNLKLQNAYQNKQLGLNFLQIIPLFFIFFWNRIYWIIFFKSLFENADPNIPANLLPKN